MLLGACVTSRVSISGLCVLPQWSQAHDPSFAPPLGRRLHLARYAAAENECARPRSAGLGPCNILARNHYAPAPATCIHVLLLPHRIRGPCPDPLYVPRSPQAIVLRIHRPRNRMSSAVVCCPRARACRAGPNQTFDACHRQGEHGPASNAPQDKGVLHYLLVQDVLFLVQWSRSRGVPIQQDDHAGASAHRCGGSRDAIWQARETSRLEMSPMPFLNT
ncbi:hypothetical protein BD626DRAFT_497685 [Schizophyllum amplum]|uniref:Uncharacterized protein n=1 Tax=Schizophyllum amplum TaxID=97359 RepID=A0A550CCW2_9AGAR|nr:hypothetical protein BD626DRAFT_497685 [Auriculariopsis ampla]